MPVISDGYSMRRRRDSEELLLACMDVVFEERDTDEKRKLADSFFQLELATGGRSDQIRSISASRDTVNSRLAME